MPRSIQHFKHRHLHLEITHADQLNNAVRVLERLPGVTAFAAPIHDRIDVEYWVDEYELTELETHLENCGFILAAHPELRAIRERILLEEETERDTLLCQRSSCRSSGVFAKTYYPIHDHFEAMPLNP